MRFPGKQGGRHSLAVAGALLATGLLIPPCFAQNQSPETADAGAIVRRAVDHRLSANAEHHPLRFYWHKRDEKHDTTREVIETPQGDVALLVAVNGKLLSVPGQQAEYTRLDNLADHAELQEHRRKREQEDSARADKLLRLLPSAFVYQIETEEKCNVMRVPDVPVPGRPAPQHVAADPEQDCYRMRFVPNPRFDPPDAEAKILRGMAGELWIEKSQERLVRLNAHLISDVDFGWGIIGRLYKGGTIYLEQADIGGGDWELTRLNLNLAGKALMVKSLSFRISEEQGRFAPVPPGTDYRKAIDMLKASAPWKQDTGISQ